MGVMKALILKDKFRRSKITIFEDKQKCLKSLKHNRKLNIIWWSRYKLSSLPFREINTRCAITGRGKAVNRNFKLSRLEFRRWAALNILPGIHKGSW